MITFLNIYFYLKKMNSGKVKNTLVYNTTSNDITGEFSSEKNSNIKYKFNEEVDDEGYFQTFKSKKGGVIIDDGKNFQRKWGNKIKKTFIKDFEEKSIIPLPVPELLPECLTALYSDDIDTVKEVLLRLMLETTNKPISYTPVHIIHKDIIKKNDY